MSNKIKVKFKKEDILINELLKDEEIENYKEPTLFSKLGFSSKSYPDIYFHSGVLDEESIGLVNNSKFTIANCYSTKQEMIKKCSVDNSQIEVIYPTIDYEYLDPKESKKQLAKEFGFDKKTKLILFHSKNLKNNGVFEFLEIMTTLVNDNFKVLIVGDKKQIYNLQFKFPKYDLNDEVIFIEDYKNINLIYAAADVYILPTYNKSFNSNVIKAMFYKTAVLVSSYSASRELIDVFSTMDSPMDRSTTFKIQAILNNKDELKKIKKENKKKSEEFLFDIQLDRVKSVIAKLG